jgi:hypothetical protein
MICPECGSSRVTSAPDTLPVCRDCDWTGWTKNPPMDQERFARGLAAAVAANNAVAAEILGTCTNGHTWMFVRRYNGTETYNVVKLIDQETGDELSPDTVAPDDPRTFDVVCNADAKSDGYDGIIEEFLECQVCPAVISAEHIDGMDTTFE